MSTYQIDLNSDIGESFGAYTIGQDDNVIKEITSANSACGLHAGDPLIMEDTIKKCKAASVAIGAHPGYPDLIGFGRRSISISPSEAKAYLL